MTLALCAQDVTLALHFLSDASYRLVAPLCWALNPSPVTGLGCRSVIGKGLQDSKMSPRGREEKQPHLWPLPKCWARDGAVGRHTVSPGWRPCWRVNACLLFGSWKGTWLLLLLKGQVGVE